VKRGAYSFAAILIATLHFAGCGAVLRAIDPGADKVPKLAEAARKIAPSAPKPLWSATIRAPETDILQFVSENRILVGEVRIGSGTAILPLATIPSTGPIALYDADSGRQLWTRSRPPLPPGQYAVVAVSPVILLLGTDGKKAVYTAVDPDTGAVRWEQTFSAPYAAVPSPDGQHLVVTSGGWFSRKLAALDIRSGAALWERSLDKDQLPKDRSPMLTSAGDGLLLAGKAVLRISPRTGADVWTVPSPLLDEQTVSAAEWGNGILLAGKTRAALLDGGTGAVRWTRRVGDGTIRAALPSEGAALLWIREAGKGYEIRDRIVALGAKDGRPLWEVDAEGEIRSPLLLSGNRFLYTIDTAVIARELAGGKVAFRTNVPGGFDLRGRSAGVLHLLPDLIEPRGDAVVVVRETFGVAKVSTDGGKLLFARKIPYASTYNSMFDARASALFGAYWKGHMKDLKPAEERFKAAMSSLSEGAAVSAQRTAATSALVARAGSPRPRDRSGTGAGSSFASEQARREIKAYDQAISREIEAGKTPADRTYRALAEGRSLARETRRQESQARATTLTGEKARLMVKASMDQMWATIDLCNAVMGFLDSLSATIRESEGLRRYVDLRHSIEIHSRSLQGRLYVRPFQPGEAQGMIVVDLETGDGANIVYAVHNRDMAKDFGVDLPQVAEAPGGERIVTKGIGLDPAAYESYSLSPFLFPYPSILSFDVESFSLGKGPFDDPDIVEVAGKGDIGQLREFLAVGGSPHSRDSYGKGALVSAAENGHTEVVRALLRAGARPNDRDAQGALPLHTAIAGGHAASILALLEAGADVNAFDASGASPLFQAGAKGRPEAVRLLLSRGADVNRLHTAQGWSVHVAANIWRGFCKDAACHSRFDEAIDLLRKAGAK
jgi:outer membrane protein assembly factor BamB